MTDKVLSYRTTNQKLNPLLTSYFTGYNWTTVVYKRHKLSSLLNLLRPRKCLALIAQRLRVQVPLRWRHFLSQKHFHKNTCLYIANEWCCLHSVNISNASFASKIFIYRHIQYPKTRDRKCLALVAQMVRAFGMNPKVGGSNPPHVETVSVSKNVDTFTRTPVRVSKMNAVARTQLIFQMSFFLQK